MRLRRWWRYRYGWSALLVLSVSGMVFWTYRPDHAMRSATGLTAHNLCSGVFISQLLPELVFDHALRPLLGPVAHVVAYQVDHDGQSVTASFAGTTRATARFQPGFGCRLVDAGEAPFSEAPAVPQAQATPLSIRLNPALESALDRVFAEQSGAPRKRVKAVVVVHRGEVVAERYAPPITAETPLLGWSIAKSYLNALVGILVREGRLSVDSDALAAEWQLGDPRRALTVDDLLRMSSGLDAPEQGRGADIVNRMLYASQDMAAFAATRPLLTAPRTHWDYTSANTLILSRAVGQVVGGGAAGLRNFAERELFAPIGMRNVTMEFDAAGTFIGSSYLYATARDHARFGMLFLADGVAPSGKRVLPKAWAAWSARSTLGRGYGAGFWTNDGPSEAAKNRVQAGFPRDGYFASGNMGQRIYIVPSAGLVIVRLADSDPPDFGIDDDMRLIASALES